MYPLEVISLRFKAGELTEKLLEALTKDPRVQVAKRLNDAKRRIHWHFSMFL